jgi:myosin heavy subunit
MKEFGLSDEALEAIWRLLGAILELGNIQFEDVDQPTGPAAQLTDQSQSHVLLAAQLFDLPVDQLVAVLLTREMKTTRETFTIPLKARESFQGRNAFLKTVYSNLFTVIMNAINRTLSSEKQMNSLSEKEDKEEENEKTGVNTISVLDIFGFESFERNDFEQVHFPPHSSSSHHSLTHSSSSTMPMKLYNVHSMNKSFKMICKFSKRNKLRYL